MIKRSIFAFPVLAFALAAPLHAQTAGMRTDPVPDKQTGAAPSMTGGFAGVNCDDPSRAGTSDCVKSEKKQADRVARGKAGKKDKSTVVPMAGPNGEGAVRSGG